MTRHSLHEPKPLSATLNDLDVSLKTIRRELTEITRTIQFSMGLPDLIRLELTTSMKVVLYSIMRVLQDIHEHILETATDDLS